MPLAAAAVGFLGTAGGAAVASAGIGAVGSIYAANQQNKANDKSLAAQNAATQQQLALQKQQYDDTVQRQQPFVQGGAQGFDALLKQYNLGSYAGQAAGGPDYQAYLAANPDVAAEAERAASEVGDVNKDGQTNALDYAQFHYDKYGKNEGRQLATIQPGAGNQTAEQQLQTQIGAEPTFAPRPTYERPTYTRPDYQEADVSLDKFQASPDYNFRLKEGSRNLNAFNAAKGVLGSGAALKSLVDYGQNTAAAEYGNWRGYVTGQTDKRNDFNQNAFGQDRAYGASAFSQDRGYGTDIYNSDRANTLNRYDANRNYKTDRADQQTNNLFNLASIGQNAAANVGNAGASYANNSGRVIQNNADSMSSAFQQRADTNSGLANGLAGLGQGVFNAFGSYNSRPAGGYNQGNYGGAQTSSQSWGLPAAMPITNATWRPGLYGNNLPTGGF